MSLKIYYHDILAGTIELDSGIFTYDEAWEILGFPISESLPFGKENSVSDVKNFFRNLLPEGTRSEFYATLRKVDMDEPFEILKNMGEDLAGAFSIVEEEPQLQELKDVTDVVLEKVRERERLDGLAGQKMSLAGIDSKTALIVMEKDGEKRFFQPDVNNPSTHILKASKSLVANEFFCMALAKFVGLETAEAEMVSCHGEEAYLVKRFDRTEASEYAPDTVRRLHQEDFCQFLARPPKDKYCDNGNKKGVTNKEICYIFDTFLDSRDKLEFIKAEMYSLCIGNTDAHAKNYAIIYGENGPRLAPLYDLVSVLGSKRLTREWSDIDIGLSRPFGGCMDISKVKEKNFQMYADDMDMQVTDVYEIFMEISEKVLNSLNETLAFTRNQAEKLGLSVAALHRVTTMQAALVEIIEKRTIFLKNKVETCLEKNQNLNPEF